jgi:uncharacterized protein YqfB (UPF0267 family)
MYTRIKNQILNGKLNKTFANRKINDAYKAGKITQVKKIQLEHLFEHGNFPTQEYIDDMIEIEAEVAAMSLKEMLAHIKARKA